jgi:predicted MFS family arabinose efflux permease
LINAFSYLAVIYSLAIMRAAELDMPTPVARAKGALREGVRYVLDRPDLVFIFVVAFAVGTFGLNFQITSALMATQEYGKGAEEYGLLGTMMALGSLAGSLMAARRGYPRRVVLVLAAVSFGLVEIAAGLMPTYLLFAIWMPVLGFTALTTITALQTVVQLSVDPEVRGRVVGLYMMIFMGGTPVGAPIIGWVGDAFGAPWTLIGGGAATIVSVLLASWWVMRKQHIALRNVHVLPARAAA